MKGPLWDDPICSIPTCPAGQAGGWGYQYPDGPCGAVPCGWPEGCPTRVHFTARPAAPIADAGKQALFEQQVRKMLAFLRWSLREDERALFGRNHDIVKLVERMK